MPEFDPNVVKLVRTAVAEDIGQGDVTSLACLEPEPIRARIIAKSSGHLSGIIPAVMTFQMIDSANTVRINKKDGDAFEVGEVLMEVEGLNQTILTAERTALNFMAHLSGVATLTATFVERVRGTHCVILDTRKTTPGWRTLEKMAVTHGGGQNHRYGLYDMMLIKDNHIAAAGSIKNAVARARNYLLSPDYRLQFGAKDDTIDIEVEVTTPEELAEAIEAGVKRLLLDNQSTESLRILVAKARGMDPEVKLEASGNVSLETVAEIAATGVDYISIGALTHSARACDFSMRVSD